MDVSAIVARCLRVIALLIAGCAGADVHADEPEARTADEAAAPAPPAPPAAPASPLQADLGRASDDADETCADLKTEPFRWGVVILGSESDLGVAEQKARAISEQTGVPFSTEGYSLHPRSQRPRHVRSYEGAYYPRTGQCKDDRKECITIERSSAYARFKPNLFVIVGAVVAEEAPASFAKYRAAVPDAYVKYSPLAGDPGGYGATSACAEWDVIVLARTETFAAAEAIAREVSQRTGVPYTPRTPQPSPADYYAGRTEPYPNISIESDNAYGEREQSPYFLVVGGELDASETNTDEALFERYKQVAPNAYRMKRARHVCGA